MTRRDRLAGALRGARAELRAPRAGCGQCGRGYATWNPVDFPCSHLARLRDKIERRRPAVLEERRTRA